MTAARAWPRPWSRAPRSSAFSTRALGGGRSEATKRFAEAPLFAFLILSQLVFWLFAWNDDHYAALTVLSLLLCYG